MAVDDLHDPGEVEERAAKAVDLVDDDAVDLPALDRGEEPFERWPIHASAREAAVVVPPRKTDPAGVLLARDVRLGGLALGVEGVELLLEPLLGALPGVDGAAHDPRGLRIAIPALRAARRAHEQPPRRPKPKKWKPFQWAPVMARATAVSDR
jgi:hypothetical protein